MDIALELLKLGLVGLVAGLFSSFLANRDHRHRKWWELRVSAYRDAIEALSDLVHFYERHYTAEIRRREISAELSAQLDAFWEQSSPRIRRLADTGAFLFSERANTALRDFMRVDDADCYVEHLDNNLHKAKRCLAELVDCSRVDLRLKPSLLPWLE
ncbi:MAG: hypothetical protein U0625_07140 [Phycisphaerales bacterium]